MEPILILLIIILFLSIIFILSKKYSVNLLYKALFQLIRQKHIIVDYYFDFRYKIKTTNYKELCELDINFKNIIHGKRYQGTPYLLLDKIFDYINSIPDRTEFIDFGSGKGRTLFMALQNGFNKVTGVEFASDLCEIANKNLESLQTPERQINIINDDVLNFTIPTTANTFFFFNPFTEVVLEQVLEKIKNESTHPNKLIIYVNPIKQKIFQQKNYKLINVIHSLNHNNIVHFYQR